ncbi:MAG: T9SS type A sorting domain-containing protein [Bacteroidota bacterium]|uniref:T9SS type A sorting domain-containing protein n=1 Tax=Runella sp. TaxID=1960881 RepID=UPI0030175BC5
MNKMFLLFVGLFSWQQIVCQSCTVNSVTVPSTSFCEGGTVQLSANITLSSGLTNNIVWNWIVTGGVIISGGNTANPTVEIATPGTCNISVSFVQYNSANPNDPPCTSNTYFKAIAVNTNLSGTLSTSTPIVCKGQSIKLIVGISDGAPSPSGYDVSISGVGTISNVYNGQEIVVNSAPVGSNIYVLQSIKNSTTGCVTTTPVSISATVNPLPNLLLTDLQCNSDQTWNAQLSIDGKFPLELNAVGFNLITVNQPYLWLFGFIPNSWNNLETTLTDANQCSVMLTVHKPLCGCPNLGPISMNPDTLEVCEGIPTFNTNPINGITNTVDQVVLYEIVDPIKGIVVGAKSSNAFSSKPEFTFPSNIVFDKKYIIRATVVRSNGIGQPDLTDSCKLVTIDSNTVVYFRRKPDTSISSPSVCTGNNFTIKLDASSSEYQYSWTRDGLPYSNLDSLQFINAGPDNLGFYALTVTSSNGCTSSNSIEVTEENIQSTPVPNIYGLETPCLNQYDVIYHANPFSSNKFTWEVSGGGGDIIYKAGDSISIHWVSAGEKILSVIEETSAGCIGSQDFTVIVGTETSPQVASVVYAPLSHALICTNNNFYCYQWGKSTHDAKNNITGVDVFGNEVAQAIYFGVNFDPIKDLNTWYWVDIWNSRPCGSWNNATCPTRCYFKREYPKDQFVHPIDSLGGPIDSLASARSNLHLFPNPANSSLQISGLSLSNAETADVMISNMDGRLIQYQKYAIVDATHAIDIDMANLKPGLYILAIIDPIDGDVLRKTFVVQH